ncbi:alkaline shock response membrane anchor protein AmaP [Modestobacter sp. I12A-02628]|uniref:Alkaline shock response membrane anchor protein AmaP n=1 Tax=Goekera deserti TaxID=2497753 RepID=A0A7K3WIH7_9ACTN|nr:alkaline shock response membrane anchor protein AmaP [Goekera deserti]MPQ96633.1 alkaline shock response membrane anchor protein AmaP [Goekera deserti]NDI47055.1 alkaline shock response membrane anchor protein AmaP [Goekera deserti]NEL56291.1 alkaline shock response membrane anchor protein AmaP [Goekera deserti]
MSGTTSEPPVARGPAALVPATRTRRAVRVNRVTLGVLGLLLAAAGAAALAVGLGRVSGVDRDDPVLDGPVRDLARDSGWVWPALGAATALLALYCLWWLLTQARTDRVGDLRVAADDLGTIDLVSRALADAVGDEVESYPGVTRAVARLTGSAQAPALSLRVTLDGSVPPDDVHARLVDEAVAHARLALGREDLTARVELVVPQLH